MDQLGHNPRRIAHCDEAKDTKKGRTGKNSRALLRSCLTASKLFRGKPPGDRKGYS